MSPADETTTQPHRPKGDVLLACTVWGVVLSTAVLEAFLLSDAISSTRVGGFDRISFYLSSVGMVLFWIYFLLLEWIDRYNLRRARSMRRLGWITQGVIFAIEAAGTWQGKQTGRIVGALFAIAISQVVWKAWMSTMALHPDDQKIVDEVIAEEERLLAEDQQKQTEQFRREKLDDALKRVRRFTAHTPLPEGTEQAPRWILPKGRHDPVVYFITNGDRVKIGTTTDIRARIRRLALRPENVALLLAGGRDRERALHRQFAAQRVGTSEWFRHTGSLVQFIADENVKIRAADKPAQH